MVYVGLCLFPGLLEQRPTTVGFLKGVYIQLVLYHYVLIVKSDVLYFVLLLMDICVIDNAY